MEKSKSTGKNFKSLGKGINEFRTGYPRVHKKISKSTGYESQGYRLEQSLEYNRLSKITGKDIKEYRLGYSRVQVRIFKSTG